MPLSRDTPDQLRQTPVLRGANQIWDRTFPKYPRLRRPPSPLAQQPRNTTQRQLIAFGTAAHDHSIRPLRDVGVMAKRLALVNVGDVDLDHRPVKGVQRIENGNGWMYGYRPLR